VSVVEIAGHRGDGIDPGHYQRFNEALALLRQGQSPETDLRMLQRQSPNDHVIEMWLERLHAIDDDLPHEIVFEFDRK
jgi:hypothetical protein